jgi:hypothetical protein
VALQNDAMDAEQRRRSRWRKARVILLTVAFIVVPFGGILAVLFGARLFSSRQRRPDAYTEWLSLRSVARSHTFDKPSRSDSKA